MFALNASASYLSNNESHRSNIREKLNRSIVPVSYASRNDKSQTIEQRSKSTMKFETPQTTRKNQHVSPTYQGGLRQSSSNFLLPQIENNHNLRTKIRNINGAESEMMLKRHDDTWNTTFLAAVDDLRGQY